MKSTIFLLTCFLASLLPLVGAEVLPAPTPFWYAEPAKDWKSAIPLGNGRLGAMIFGGVNDDQILINEHSIWSGKLITQNNNPEGPALIREMRELMFEGRYTEATALCAKKFFLDSRDNRSYQPFGFLRLKTGHDGETTDYRRSLDAATGVGTVTYRNNGVTFTREVFASHPDQVIAMSLSADKPGSISFTASLDRPFGATVRAHDSNQLRMSGQAIAKDGKHPGVRFDGIVHFEAKGGKVFVEEGQVRVEGADSATIMVAVETDYNLNNPSAPLTRSLEQACVERLEQAKLKPYARLKADHTADFATLFDRSALVVGSGEDKRQDWPLDKRIAEAAKGSDDPALLMAYYRYCRYLLISGSRAGGLPMNLQGIWNPMMAAPWEGNFHININIQEGYWFAEPGNLPECHEPFMAMTQHLATNGKEMARVMLGVKRGFAAGHRTDAWFYAYPTGASPKWGMYVLGGAWCAQHMMEHYRFTQDKAFLEKRAFPVIREAALFFVDWLVEDPKTGKLVSGPSASAENQFKVPGGGLASVSMGPSQDQEIIWSTFRDYLEAGRALGVNEPEMAEVRDAMSRLALPKIGEDGRLLEWAEPFEESEPGHRHLSHLWGMMPGDRITLEKTPDLATAVRKSLDYRLAHNYDAQGWSLGWVTCMMVRLKQGDRALKLIKESYFRKAYPNLFVDAHGQVQVADMMGVSMAMMEMLIQSHSGEIELLPALPAAWPDGKITGICARGGFVFDLVWKDGRLATAFVQSRVGGPCTIKYGEKRKTIPTEAGRRYAINF